MSWFSPSFSGALVNAQSRRYGGALVGLVPQTKLEAPQNGNMKHYKLMEFVKFECQAPPRSNVKPFIDDFLATPLL